jgi:hypothetical protein
MPFVALYDANVLYPSTLVMCSFGWLRQGCSRHAGRTWFWTRCFGTSKRTAPPLTVGDIIDRLDRDGAPVSASLLRR